MGRGVMPRGQPRSGADGRTASGQEALKWLASYGKVSRHLAPLTDLEQRLDANGGLVRIPDVLPAFVADAVLAALQASPGGTWNSTAAQEDPTHNNIAHAFWSTKSGEGLDAAIRALSLLLPGRLHSFSAARYDRGHHIAPHDDRAYTQVCMEDGSIATCSRDIAVVYYLTKDWLPEWGGALVDLEQGGPGGRTYVPLFNSLVAFRVPHFHQVTPLTTDRPRYSIFGWFLEEGIKYDLFTGAPECSKRDVEEEEEGSDGIPAEEVAGGSHRQACGAGHGAALLVEPAPHVRTRKKKKRRRTQQAVEALQQHPEVARMAACAPDSGPAADQQSAAPPVAKLGKGSLRGPASGLLGSEKGAAKKRTKQVEA